MSCNLGDTTLAELAIVVGGEDQIGFQPGVRSYEAWLPGGSNVASIRARPIETVRAQFSDLKHHIDNDVHHNLTLTLHAEDERGCDFA